jgi:hypothetical protein
MIGEKRILTNPKNANETLMEKLENGVIQPRTTWITTSYEQDKDALTKIQREKENELLREEIFKLKSGGMLQKDIAIKMDLTPGRISQILKNEPTSVSQADLA